MSLGLGGARVAEVAKDIVRHCSLVTGECVVAGRTDPRWHWNGQCYAGGQEPGEAETESELGGVFHVCITYHFSEFVKDGLPP
jgi:hypothetical protein